MLDKVAASNKPSSEVVCCNYYNNLQKATNGTLILQHGMKKTFN